MIPDEAAHFTAIGEDVEQLDLLFYCSRFRNGAHIYLSMHIRSDKPDEVEIRLYSLEDLEDIRILRVSSTAGNFNHLRILWLGDKVIDARELYASCDEQLTPKKGATYSWDYSVTLFARL